MNTDCPVVLIEGLFVLCREDGWESVSSQMDCKIFLQIPQDLCEKQSVERKAVGNKISRDEALAHFHRVDGPNFCLIERSAVCADVVLGVGRDYRFTHAVVRCM